MIGNGSEMSSCDCRACLEKNTANQSPQILLNNQLVKYDNDNDDTIHSKISNGTARGLIQLMKTIDERRNQRARKTSEAISDLAIVVPEVGFRSNIKNYKQKLAVYNFLHRPKGWKSYLYHVFVFVMVFACLILTVFSTIKEFSSIAWKGLLNLEKFMIIWFAGEFAIRLWSSGCKQKYNGWSGKLLFLRSPFRIIDLLVIVTSIIVLWSDTGDGHEVFAASAFRGFHRFFQVLQMIRLERQFRPWKILASVVYDQREQLIITAYIGFLALCFVAFLSYLVEKDSNENFNNIADALWWAVVTLCTVGYGDRVPVTWLGKLIASIFTLLGVCIFALPAGIIGTGLALRIQEEHRRHHKIKKKVPAAELIQCAWRCYASNSSNYVATWARSRVMRGNSLTEREMNAIRFIRMVKFMVAKNKFTAQRRPADVKDVLEQYERGHSDVLGRIKVLQQGLNMILEKSGGGSGAASSMRESRRNLYDMRLETVEGIVKDIEKKLVIQNEYIQQIANDRSIMVNLVQLMRKSDSRRKSQ